MRTIKFWMASMERMLDHPRVRSARRAYVPIVPAGPPGGTAGGRTDLAVLEGYARVMEESGCFKVLRRMPVPRPTPMFRAPGARLALCVDVETTGPDPSTDEVVELAVVPFQYADTGRIVAVHEPVAQLREPQRSIPAELTRLTGLDAEAVRGKSIDDVALQPLLAEASLVVAHNAAWDRPFLERLLPGFAHLPWGCVMTQIPWREDGAAGRGLAAIAAGLGFFYDAHRAVDDCLATIEILGRPLPRSGGSAMGSLLRATTTVTHRVWALHSPYEARDVLRGRGYRWSNGADGQLRAWYRDVAEDGVDREVGYLRDHILGHDADIPTSRVTAYERFSCRG